MADSTARRGLIFFAHGSRDPQWREPIEAVAARARALDHTLAVRCAYLELMQPDLPACAAELAHAGVSAVAIVPMFLGAGRHAREDLPALIAEIRARHPQMALEVRPAIGEDERVLDMLARIALASD